jgi:superfamily II DNA or RNA helicase
MQFEKRRYQERAVEEFVKWFNTDEKLATIILPTGTGKTFTAALCLQTQPQLKILWCAHREELIDQAQIALKLVMPTQKITIEMADRKADPTSDIVVGSVQTISKDRKHFEAFKPDIIVIDEYHHYSKGNIQYDGLLTKWPDAKILGLTATPWRFSGEELPLGKVLIQMDIGTAVDKKYLVPPKAESLITGISLAEVKTRMGDFAMKDLSKAVNVDSRNKMIAKRVIELIKNDKRQGIIFAVDVDHSKAMYELLKNEVRAAEIYGETPIEERRRLMKQIKNGEIDVLCNNLVSTEGFDVPHLSFICQARPTKSLGLYYQMIGRGLRTCSKIDKIDCLVIDVHDKIKVKQTRITFGDMAANGDLYGDKKRAVNVLKADIPVEPISNKLKNFPILINKEKSSDRWTVDEETFSISSWAISSDQWIVTWTSESKEAKILSKAVYVPWTELPPIDCDISNRSVQHVTFGNGKVIKILDRDHPKILVEFGWGNQKIIEMTSLNVQKFIKEYSPSEVETIKTDKLYYLCMPENIEEPGRVVHFIKEGKDLILKDDRRLFKLEADAYLQGEAMKDGILQLVRTNSKWKFSPASEKQKKYVEGLFGKIGFDIDIDSITKGDASAIIDQIKWQEIIHKKFGTDYKERLLGYNGNETDDL